MFFVAFLAKRLALQPIWMWGTWGYVTGDWFLHRPWSFQAGVAKTDLFRPKVLTISGVQTQPPHHLGGGFKYFVFTPILGEMIQPVMGLWGSFYAEKSALQNRKTAGDSKECERDDRQGGAAPLDWWVWLVVTSKKEYVKKNQKILQQNGLKLWEVLAVQD